MENLLIYKFYTVWVSSSAFLYKQITRTWCTIYIGDSITEYRCRNRILYMRMRGKTVQRNLWKAWPSHPQINNKTIPVADNGAEPCLLVLLALCSEASESYKPTMPSYTAAKNVSKNPQKQKVYVKWYPQSCLFFLNENDKLCHSTPPSSNHSPWGGTREITWSLFLSCCLPV